MRTTPEETERNNQMILDAAIRVFAQKGYENTNIQDVAKEAHISRGPIYYRYQTKEALFRAAFTEQMKREMDEYRRILQQDKYILDIFREDLYFYANSLVPGMELSILHSPDLTDMKQEQILFNQNSQDVFSLKIKTVERAIAKGEMRLDANPRRIVNMIYIFAKGLLPVTNQQLIDIETKQELLDAIDDILYLVKTRYCL